MTVLISFVKFIFEGGVGLFQFKQLQYEEPEFIKVTLYKLFNLLVQIYCTLF